MANNNVNLLQHRNNVCCHNEHCRRIHIVNATRKTEAALYNEFLQLEGQNARLDDLKFSILIHTLTTGYAWRQKCMERNVAYRSFGAALNTHPLYRNMDGTEKQRLCRKMAIVKKVYENWDDISTNLSHPAIRNIDVCNLSLRQLSGLIEWRDVVKFNAEHGPRAPRQRTRPLYPNAIINEIVGHIEQNTTLLHDVDFDEEQIKMIGRDISNALLRIAANR